MKKYKHYSTKDKSILITGCSSGIGKEMAVKLANYGFTVFASVRKESSAEELRGLRVTNLVPIYPLDLTDASQIIKSAEFVEGELNRRGIKGLFALINNAGGGKPSPVELMNLENFKTELHTRILGSVAMVQSFLPFIRQANGRIIWIMTPAVIPMPYVTSIHACDFATNFLARTLDIELKPWKIPNIMIRCGGIKTPAGMRTSLDVEEVLKNGSEEKVMLYKNAFRKWGKEMEKFDEKRTEPSKVAGIVLKALISEKPRQYYSVGYMSKAAGFLELLPQPIVNKILKMRF